MVQMEIEYLIVIQPQHILYAASSGGICEILFHSIPIHFALVCPLFFILWDFWTIQPMVQCEQNNHAK